MRLVLASQSPRRAELLRAAGYSFEIFPTEVDESAVPGEEPREYALRIARAKARRAQAECRDSGSAVLAADTVVVRGARMMGKPADSVEAESMLKTLSDGVHEVHTAVVLRTPRRELSEVVTTRVHLLPLSDSEIAWYIGTGEPEGKAGAYAIQGHAARFIDWIEGSWSNVVGLPIATLNRMLNEVGEVD